MFAVVIFNGCKNKEFIEPYAKSDGGNPKDIGFNPDLEYGTVMDVDGNYYKTIQIGTQTWMAENLRVTRFRNGDVIPNITDNSQWAGLKTAAWCNYDNDSHNNKIYGKLYNAFVLTDKRSICPEGWHIPTAAEWSVLINFSGTGNSSGALKEADTKHWSEPNTGATNSLGFTAIPGGFRDNVGDGMFHDVNAVSMFANSTPNQFGQMICRLSYNTSKFETFSVSKNVGTSLRCVKD